MSRKDRNCPDCVNSGTAPVRKLEGRRRSCPGHAEQRLRHAKRLYARRREEARAPRGRSIEDPFRPEPLTGPHSSHLVVDPWWMEAVSVCTDRLQADADTASAALRSGTHSGLRAALRNLLISQEALDLQIRLASRHVGES